MAMFESKYIFFYGHHPRYGDKHYLSNWCPSPFVSEEELELEDEPHVYENNEQYMMAEKARLFNDSFALEQIMSSNDPSVQKSWGRKVEGFDKDKWEEIARKVVFKANYAKFSQHEDWKKQLLDTGNKVIVEASPYDRIWGIGLGCTDSRALDPEQWRGTNWLGEAIMEVRDILRQLESKPRDPNMTIVS